MNSTKAWDVVVVGSANTDYVVRGKDLPKPGETALGEEFQIAFGGKGANQAVAAARLGAKVAFIGCLGDDERGDAIIKQLQDEGIDTSHVVRDSETPTGAAVIQIDESGEKQIFMAPNANGKLKPSDIQNTSILRDACVVMTQFEIPLEVVLEVSRMAKASDVMLMLDPSPPDTIPDELYQQLSLIKPNSSEAEVLTGIRVTDPESARQAAEKLRQRGAQAVAIQAGDKGNLLIWQEGEVFLPKLDVESIDATGAGDAFAGALAVAFAEGQSWKDAGHFANTAAALTTTKLGAQPALPDRQQVEDFMAKKSGKKPEQVE